MMGQQQRQQEVSAPSLFAPSVLDLKGIKDPWSKMLVFALHSAVVRLIEIKWSNNVWNYTNMMIFVSYFHLNIWIKSGSGSETDPDCLFSWLKIRFCYNSFTYVEYMCRCFLCVRTELPVLKKISTDHCIWYKTNFSMNFSDSHYRITWMSGYWEQLISYSSEHKFDVSNNTLISCSCINHVTVIVIVT